MAKPPETPPSSDIDGVHEDRVDRRASKNFDAKAQAQMEADARETVGRPKRGQTVPAKPDAAASS
jgi:hypothetical protein